MIQDCRANRPEGWSYFLTNYLPVVRQFLKHYFPDRAADQSLLERVLRTNLFQSLDPAPERTFVAELRQHVLRAVEADRASAAPEISIDIEALGAALEPLTLTEKLVAWFETMYYAVSDTGRMLRMFAANRGEDPRPRRRVDPRQPGCLAQFGAPRERTAAGPGRQRTIHQGLLTCQSLLRRDRRPHDLARPRGNGATCERLLALPGSLLPPARSGGRAARLEAAARSRGRRL